LGGVHGVAKLGLESRAQLSQLPHGASDLPGRIREPVGAEHEECDHKDDEDLGSADAAHSRILRAASDRRYGRTQSLGVVPQL
jgi:hypothetical protein